MKIENISYMYIYCLYLKIAFILILRIAFIGILSLPSQKFNLYIWPIYHIESDRTHELDHYIINEYKLFHFMGKYIGHISHVSSGNICGIGGIHSYSQKNGYRTISNINNKYKCPNGNTTKKI